MDGFVDKMMIWPDEKVIVKWRQQKFRDDFRMDEFIHLALFIFYWCPSFSLKNWIRPLSTVARLLPRSIVTNFSESSVVFKNKRV